MKKIMICSVLLLLTGCQSINEVRDADRMNHSMTVSSRIQETVTYIDDEWIALQEELEQAERGGEWHYQISSDYYQDLYRNGVVLSDDVLCIENISTEQSKKDIEVIATRLGKEFGTFMSNADMLEIMKPSEVKETIIGTYGIVLQKVENGMYEGFDLYLCKSSLILKDEKEQAWLEEVCGNDVLLSAVSQGAEGHLLELSTPSRLVRGNIDGPQGISTYYQIFKGNDAAIRKIRMVIKQGENADSNISENQAEVLQRLVSSASGEEIEVSNLIEAIESRLSGKSGAKKGIVGKLSYNITQESNSVVQENMIIVELEKNKK